MTASNASFPCLRTSIAVWVAFRFAALLQITFGPAPEPLVVVCAARAIVSGISVPLAAAAALVRAVVLRKFRRFIEIISTKFEVPSIKAFEGRLRANVKRVNYY